MLAADANVVQKIVDLAPVQEIVLAKELSLDGREHHFTTKGVVELTPKAPPELDKVVVHTLEGFAGLVRQAIDDLDQMKYVILVKDHENVILISKKTDEYGRRQELIAAHPVEFKKFPFGQFIDHEEFVIQVQALFSDTEDKDYVLRVAGSILGEASTVAEDNGFAQKVTVKAGIRPAVTETLKSQVKLAPFRTFPECGQPISNFVFRARTDEGGAKLMLVEADGGRWKIDAMNEVARYIRTLALLSEVIA